MGLTYPQLSHVISGNTAGVLSTISSGTYSLFGGSNITLSQSSNSVSIIGASAGTGGGGDSTISQFIPFGSFGTATGNLAHAQQRLTAFPFVLPLPGSFCRANIGISFAFSATASTSLQGGRVNSWAATKSIGLYSRGTGANSTRIESVFTGSISLSAINSYIHSTDGVNASATNAIAFSYVSQIDTAGGITTSSFLTSNSTTSVGGIASVSLNVTNFLGNFEVQPFKTSLPAGEYWLAILFSTATASSGVNRLVIGNNNSFYTGPLTLTNLDWIIPGQTTINSLSFPVEFLGRHSTTLAALPAFLLSSDFVSNSASTFASPFVVFMNSALT